MSDDSHVDILLIEHSSGDIRLIVDALAETDSKPVISNVRDGVEAILFLRRQPPFEDAPQPRIIILDLNLPGRDGRDVLKEIKTDPALKLTPVIVFSGSDAPNDIINCYATYANCYIVKPRDLYSFTESIRSLVEFWLKTVKLPTEYNVDIHQTA